jgi:hypothetical protein
MMPNRMPRDARALAEQLEEEGVPYEVLEDAVRSLVASREEALAGGAADTADLDRQVDFLVRARVAWESLRWMKVRLARWDRSPMGAELDGGRFRLVERVRGRADCGQFRVEQAGDPTTGLLATVGRHAARSPSAIEELGRRLAWEAPGVMPLRHLGRIDGSEHVALVEREPDGTPSHQLALPLAPAAAVHLARQLAAVLAGFHAAVGPLRFLRPELVYVDDRLSLTGLAPRAEAFLAGAAPSYQAPPVFDTAFAAPEVIELDEVTPAADVFSLAAMVGLWLTGEHLFGGDTGVEQMEAIASGRGRLWQGPVAIGMVLADAVATEPADRPPLARFVEDLERTAGRP